MNPDLAAELEKLAKHFSHGGNADIVSTLRAAASALRGEWRPTHRHAGRGTDYQLIGTALLQWGPQLSDMGSVTIYRDQHGQTWVRGSDEFNDGRFQPFPPLSDGGER